MMTGTGANVGAAVVGAAVVGAAVVVMGAGVVVMGVSASKSPPNSKSGATGMGNTTDDAPPPYLGAAGYEGGAVVVGKGAAVVVGKGAAVVVGASVMAEMASSSH